MLLAIWPFAFTALVPPPFEYRNLPFRVCAPGTELPHPGQLVDDACHPLQPEDAFHPGDIIPFIVDRCASEFFARSSALPYVLSRNLVNDSAVASSGSAPRIILPPISSEIPISGCGRALTLSHQLPDAVPPGRYYFEGVATVYGQLRTVNAYFRTQPFNISR